MSDERSCDQTLARFAPPRIMIGMPIGSGSLPWPTALSLMNTIRACDKEQVPVKLETVIGCSVVQWARSAIVDSFLKSDCTHLFFIDADIAWTPDDFFRLVGFGAVLDVVGATYPFKKEPALFLVNHDGEKDEYEVNGLGCVKIKSMGLGFTIVKREVIEKIAATKPRMRDSLNGIEMADVFRVDRAPDGGARGEDVAFFADIYDEGVDAWLDPAISIGHVGSKVYKGDVIDALGLSDYSQESSK